MEIELVLKPDGPKVNYRYLHWVEKSESVSECRHVVAEFVAQASQDGVPLEFFCFERTDQRYEVVPGGDAMSASAMTIVATAPSSALTDLLNHFELVSAGHLRGTDVSVVFDFPVVWPLDLEPGPSDILLVVRIDAPSVFSLMQRRIVTPAMLQEMRR